MRNTRIALLLAAVVSAFFSAPSAVSAASAPPQAEQTATPLTLEEAIAAGMTNSMRLAELQARGEAADFAIAGRRAADQPLLSLHGGYTRTNHVDVFVITTPFGPPQVVYPDIPDNYRARVDLQWPIYSGGRVDALERAASAERSAIDGDVAAARADLRLEITRAYWAVVTARETESVLQRSRAAVAAHVSDVKSRFASGLVPPNEVSSAEAQAAHQRLLSLEATSRRAIAEADLRRLTGNDTATALPPSPSATGLPPSPSTWLPPSAFARSASADRRSLGGGWSGGRSDQISAVLQARPERQALQSRVEAAVARADAAASAARPQVAVAGGYDYARPNPRIFPRSGDWKPSWDASINVSWNLWDGGRRAAEEGEARANASALKTRIADFDRQAAFDVRARALELEASLEAVAAADEGIRAAVDAERAIGERFKAGVATPTDVLDAQVARLQAELDRARAMANVRLAEARLERALGR